MLPETNMAGPLAELRDIHLPQPISWWPPAPGWWILLGLLLVSILAILVFLRRRKLWRYRRAALTQLERLETSFFKDGDSRRLIRELSRLMRQAALCHFPRKECAGLAGDAWLAFLDRQLKDSPFSTGAGRVLALGPYAPVPSEFEAESLLRLCRRWLQRLPIETISRGEGQ